MLIEFLYYFKSQHLEPTWDELATSLEYDPSVSISRVDCTQHRPICQEFEVKGYPTLIWIVDGKKVEKYSGSRSLDAFKTFIEDKTATVTEKLEEEQAEEEEAAEEAKVEEVGVLQLTGSSFAHGIEKGVTIVKFFAPWLVMEASFNRTVALKIHLITSWIIFFDTGAVTANVWHQRGTNWPSNSLADRL